MLTDLLPVGLSTWLPGFVSDELRPEMIDSWVDRTRQSILNELPEFASQPDLVKVLDSAVREHWLAFLAAFTQPEFQFHLPHAGTELAREAANHQLPLELLIKVYRAAQQESWSYVTGVVSAIPAEQIDHAAVLIYFWGRAGTWIDESIDASIDIFQVERTRRMAGVSAQRYEVVKEILAGARVDLKRVSAALGGYPLTVTHTGFILDTEDPDAVGDLGKVAHEVARLLGAGRPLVVHPGGRQLWAWVGTKNVPDLADLGQVAASLDALRARLYLGIPAHGVDGLVCTHRDAERTRQIADQGGPWAPLMRYDEVEVVALLGCSAEVDRFVARTLGELIAADESTQRIRETVEAFLRHGGNVEAAASELCVHRNTVRYRVGRAEEILERPVSRVGDELLLAIRHHAVFHRASGAA